MTLVHITVTAAMLVLLATPSWAMRQRVLVVHSYHETQENHVVPMTEGILQALEGMDLEIRFYHMDTKRRDSEKWKQQAGREASKLVTDFHPDLVIAMDDNAQLYFARQYANQPGAPNIVFGGVNADPAVYGYPADNVTGVLERPNILESIQLLQKIVPGMKRLAIMSDNSETAQAFVGYLQSLQLPLEVSVVALIDSQQQWQETIRENCPKVDGFGFYVLRTVSSETDPSVKVPEEQLIAEYGSLCSKPTVGFFDSAAQAGVLCAVSVSMREQGYETGKIARDILQGKPPKDISPRPTTKGRIQLNLITAERLGMEINYNVIKRADVLIRKP